VKGSSVKMSLLYRTDIDIRILKGRSEEENIWKNFSLPVPIAEFLPLLWIDSLHLLPLEDLIPLAVDVYILGYPGLVVGRIRMITMFWGTIMICRALRPFQHFPNMKCIMKKKIPK
jgi:hypothetical protein